MSRVPSAIGSIRQRAFSQLHVAALGQQGDDDLVRRAFLHALDLLHHLADERDAAPHAQPHDRDVRLRALEHRLSSTFGVEQIEMLVVGEDRRTRRAGGIGDVGDGVQRVASRRRG